MNKKLTISILLALLLTLLFTACQGQKAVSGIEITGGLISEYSLNDTPDFSKVQAKVTYNDGTAKNVGFSDLTFGAIDTTTVGTKQLTITYEGFILNVAITVKGNSLDSGADDTVDPSALFVTGTSLPESLALWSTNRGEFKNQTNGYVVGDDNSFYFTLKLSVYSGAGEKVNVTSYTSVSTVRLLGSDTVLTGEELDKYVTIDESKNAFDFTDAAVGKSFIISSRPRDYVEGKEEEMTKSFTVTVVDGYNVYEAYELNYITNSDTFDFSETNENETRTQVEIVDDFLRNEKNATRPESLNAIIIHNNLVIEKTDIPREYFLDGNRDNELYDFMSIFIHALNDTQKTFTIHGNYFAIYSYNLPCVVEEGVANQDNMVSNAQLFRFLVDVDMDKNFDHTKYTTNVKNLMLVDNDPKSNVEANAKKAMLGIAAMKTYCHVINLDNVKVQAFYISIIAERDYHTVNIKDSIFYNSYQNHIHLAANNHCQEDDEEPLANGYPRLTLNVKSSSITQSGGPAIISQTIDPALNKNKYSGALVNISDDTTIESWVSGDEAWFKALSINVLSTNIKLLNPSFLKQNSSFVKEEIKIVGGKQEKLTLMNIVMVNLLVPDMSGGIDGAINQVLGSGNVDGKLIIGGTTVMDMDDSVYNGKPIKYGSPTVSDLKESSPELRVFTTTNGGVAYTTTMGTLNIEEGDISAKSENDFLTLYFYSMAIVFGNYHPVGN
ncbi:MAG: bacterial Ig-like domain-containing protein [Clostridia bacterium]|nr:bacterial Ig-like domain-containing protein [Clostridia bacterium]